VTEVKEQDPVTVPPADRVTEAHDTARPVAGVVAVVKVTVPANPFVAPPTLAKDSAEDPPPPVVTETGELAVKVKSLRRIVLEPVAGAL